MQFLIWLHHFSWVGDVEEGLHFKIRFERFMKSRHFEMILKRIAVLGCKVAIYKSGLIQLKVHSWMLEGGQWCKDFCRLQQPTQRVHPPPALFFGSLLMKWNIWLRWKEEVSGGAQNRACSESVAAPGPAELNTWSRRQYLNERRESGLFFMCVDLLHFKSIKKIICPPLPVRACFAHLKRPLKSVKLGDLWPVMHCGFSLTYSRCYHLCPSP